jgi:hypothetical protein
LDKNNIDNLPLEIIDRWLSEHLITKLEKLSVNLKSNSAISDVKELFFIIMRAWHAKYKGLFYPEYVLIYGELHEFISTTPDDQDFLDNTVREYLQKRFGINISSRYEFPEDLLLITDKECFEHMFFKLEIET